MNKLPTTETAAKKNALEAQEKQSQLARGAAGGFAGTMLSRVLGLVRDMAVSSTFAASATDPFYVIFQIPNTVRGLLAEGAVNAAFLPHRAQVEHQQGSARAREFAAAFSGAMSLLLGLTVLLGIAGAPLLMRLYAPGYDEPRQQLSTYLLRLFFPYLLFMGAAAFSQALLNLRGSFFLPSAASALLNVGQIAACIAVLQHSGSSLSTWSQLTILTCGAVLGGLLQWLVQALWAWKLGVWVRPRWFVNGRLGLFDADVKKSLLLLAPVTLGLGVVQVNVLLSRLFASYLEAGSQSHLFYAQRLVEIPQGLFAVSVATASMPLLSRQFSEGNQQQAFATMESSLRMTLVLALPSGLFLAYAGRDILAFLFGRGQFSATDVEHTTDVLVWLAVGVLPVALIRNFAQVAYAASLPRLPLLASVVNLVVFCLFGWPLSQSKGIGGTALAMSVAACAQLVVLVVGMRRVFHVEPAQSMRINSETWLSFARRSFALLCRVSVCSLLGVVAAGLIHMTTLWHRLGLRMAVFALVFGALSFWGVPEIRVLLAALRRKLKR